MLLIGLSCFYEAIVLEHHGRVAGPGYRRGGGVKRGGAGLGLVWGPESPELSEVCG